MVLTVLCMFRWTNVTDVYMYARKTTYV